MWESRKLNDDTHPGSQAKSLGGISVRIVSCGMVGMTGAAI